MALPKINAAPKYEITVPSTQQAVRFRPYLVKEEKILMMAMETQDQKQALAAIVDTIISCLQEPIDKNLLTTFDVEYMFTQIRAKSVGESAKISVPCKQCDHSNEIEIPLESITVKNLDIQNTLIELTPEITLKMKWPSYNSVVSADQGVSSTEQTFALIAACIESVQTPDENVKLSDETEADVQAFIESLSSGQFNKIKSHVENIPKMEHELKFECTSCNTENTRMLSGISDFF